MNITGISNLFRVNKLDILLNFERDSYKLIFRGYIPCRPPSVWTIIVKSRNDVHVYVRYYLICSYSIVLPNIKPVSSNCPSL